MRLGEYLRSLHKDEIATGIYQFVNVESGALGIGSDVFPNCDSCYGVDVESLSFACRSCGRSPNNYVWCPSGDGDGIYTIFRQTSLGSTTRPGWLVFFEKAHEDSFSKWALEQSLESSNGLLSVDLVGALEEFQDCEFVELATLHNEDDMLFISDSMAGLGSKFVQTMLSIDGPVVVGAFVEPIGQGLGGFSNDNGPRARVLLITPVDFSPTDSKSQLSAIPTGDNFNAWAFLSASKAHTRPVTGFTAELNGDLWLYRAERSTNAKTAQAFLDLAAWNFLLSSLSGNRDSAAKIPVRGDSSDYRELFGH